MGADIRPRWEGERIETGLQPSPKSQMTLKNPQTTRLNAGYLKFLLKQNFTWQPCCCIWTELESL